MSATIKKYVAVNGYPIRVDVVFCEKETALCVWVNGRKALKMTDYESYFDAFSDAKQHLIEYHENKVEMAVSRLEYEQEKLAKAVLIKDPEAV